MLLVVAVVDGGEERTEGCVERMSERMCRAVVCKAAWPFVKQWMKRVRFSSARVWRLLESLRLCARRGKTYLVEQAAKTKAHKPSFTNWRLVASDSRHDEIVEHRN